MEIDDFRAELLQDVQIERGDSGFSRAAFVEHVMSSLEEYSRCEEFHPAQIIDVKGIRGSKCEMDGYCFSDGEDSILTIVIGAYSGEDAAPYYVTGDITKIANMARNCFESARSGHLEKNIQECDIEITEFIRIAKGEDNPISLVRIYVVTDAIRKDSVRELSVNSVDGIDIDVELWDIQSLYEFEIERNGKENIEITFDAPLPCINTRVEEADFDSYLTTIRGNVLADIYKKYRERLLMSNVRSYISKSKKNPAMKATIRDKPGRFFAYNNGLTVTADDVEVKDGKITKIYGFQIVNGGQTTVTIFNACTKDNLDVSKILIPVKLSIIPATFQDKDTFISELSMYSNLQNAVYNSDFASTDPYHRRMEELSTLILPPKAKGKTYAQKWFYERAKGQYDMRANSLTPANRKKFKEEHPDEKRMNKTSLAQVRRAFDLQPYKACESAENMFKSYNDEIKELYRACPEKFNEAYFKECAMQFMIFKTMTKTLVIGKVSWYNGGHRNALIYYSISKLMMMLGNEGQTLNFLKLWDLQAVPDALKQQLILIGEPINDIIHDPSKGNASDWYKKPQCWESVKSLDLNLLPDLMPYLMKDDEYKNKMAEIAESENKRAEIEALQELQKIGQNYWAGIWRLFGTNTAVKEEGNFTDSDYKLVEMAADKELFLHLLPSQAKMLMDLRPRFEVFRQF